MNRIFFPSAFACILGMTACNSTTTNHTNKDSLTAAATTQPNIVEMPVSYGAGGFAGKGYVAYDSNKVGKRPAILVVHEWWGLNDYMHMRIKKMAELGYIAFAVDMYGDGKVAENPKDAQALATPFYKDPTLTKTRLDMALQQLKTYPQTDTANIAAIGYCYGGYSVLNAAKLGEPLKGVVSFHGGLGGAPANKELLKAKILVCHGAADQFESPEEISQFKKGLDSIHADYSFKVYPDATHAFTNPASTENGKKFSMPIAYNAAADSASWNDMKAFFGTIFK